jgi:integrase/recombinase XerC
MQCAEAAARFLAYLRHERNASPHTLRHYASDLEQFAAFLKTLPDGSKEVERLDHRDLRTYLGELYAARRESSSIARKLATLRSFFRFLAREGIRRDNPARLLASPKIPARLPAVPGVQKLEELFSSLPDDDEPRPVRDRAMLELLYGCGLRAAELVALDTSDVLRDARLLRVRGKGRKERQVPYGRKAAVALERWLAARPAADPAVFVNRRGRRLTTRSVGRIVKKYAILFSGDPSLHPHSLRHAYATHMLGSGADLRAIQELLGHARLSTTQKYTQVTVEQLMEVYEKAHPKAR